MERAIPEFTSLDTANAMANTLISRYSQNSVELVDINNMRPAKQKLQFVKMRGTGNDYIYFDCFEQQVANPESLAVPAAKPASAATVSSSSRLLKRRMQPW